MGRWGRHRPGHGRNWEILDFLGPRLWATKGLLILLLLSTVAVSLQIRDHPQISPLDEMVHADYMVKVAEGHLPRVGSPVGEQLLREEACRHAEVPNFAAPPCSSRVLRPEQFYIGAYNTAIGAHPPTYYLVTGVGSRLIVALTPVRSSVTAGRILGILWLAAGLVMLWLALAELAIPPGVRLMAAAPVAVSPVVLGADAFITNDAPAVLVGASILWAVLRWENHRASGWLPLAISAMAGAIKATNLLGVAVMALYLMVRAVRCRRYPHAPGDPPPRSHWPAIALACFMPVVGAAVNGAYLKLAAARALPNRPPNPLEAIFHVSHLDLGQLVAQVSSGLSPVANPYTPTPLARHGVFVTLTFALNLLILGGCLASAGGSPSASRREALGVSALVVLGAMGPALAAFVYLTSHTFFPIPARYGLTVLPMLVATLATLLDKGMMRVLVGVFSTATVALTITRLATG